LKRLGFEMTARTERRYSARNKLSWPIFRDMAFLQVNFGAAVSP